MTPEDWSAMQLEVQVVSDEKGGMSMPHKLTSPEGHARPIVATTDEVHVQTKRMWNLFSSAGRAWVGMVMLVYFSDGNWAYRVNYRYE